MIATASNLRAVGTLVRFHWRAGARVALRANAIVGAVVVFFFGIESDALARLRAAILELVGRHAGSGARMQLAAICVALAGVAMPRVTLDSTGWMRSLAVSSATSRRAAFLSLAGTQAFAIAVSLLSMLGAVIVYHATLDAAKIVSLPLMFLAAASLVLPVERRFATALGALALVLAVPGRWTTTVLAGIALLSSDRFAGAIVGRAARDAGRGDAVDRLFVGCRLARGGSHSVGCHS